jgi:hypothetical protein
VMQLLDHPDATGDDRAVLAVRRAPGTGQPTSRRRKATQASPSRTAR